jgi:chlorobactene glucosyltransferase
VAAAGVLRYGRLLRDAAVHDPVITPTTFDQRVSPAPTVSVIVAARNEEQDITACLDSLLAQDYPHFDVTVVDYRSEDATAEMVEGYVGRDRRVRLIRNRELPEGWTGRNHALGLGAHGAPGEFLLFLDADTVHAPQNLSQTVTYAVRNHIDMLSLVGRLRNCTFWQKFLHPVASLILMMQYPLNEVNDPNSRKAFAHGQYVLIRRKVYDRIGGRDAIRSAFMDMALAVLVKQAGFKLWLAHAGQWLSQTHVGRSFPDIWRTWTRLFLGGFNRSLRMLAGVLLRQVLFFLVPFLLLLGVAAALVLGHGTPLLWTLFALTTVVLAGEQVMATIGYRLCDADLRYAPLFFPACFIVAAILLNAGVKLWLNRSMVWKGQRFWPRNGVTPSS